MTVSPKIFKLKRKKKGNEDCSFAHFLFTFLRVKIKVCVQVRFELDLHHNEYNVDQNFLCYIFFFYALYSVSVLDCFFVKNKKDLSSEFILNVLNYNVPVPILIHHQYRIGNNLHYRVNTH